MPEQIDRNVQIDSTRAREPCGVDRRVTGASELLIPPPEDTVRVSLSDDGGYPLLELDRGHTV